MIVFKLLLLLLFCDCFMHINAQLNTCVSPEGAEGLCMNIWDCSIRVKYVFSNEQNSIETFNILKSVCDYTNSVIKLCCTSSSNSILPENKKLNKRKVREIDTNTNDKRVKRQDLYSFKNINCNNNDDNISKDNTNNNNSNANNVAAIQSPKVETKEIKPTTTPKNPMLIKVDDDKYKTYLTGQHIYETMDVKSPDEAKDGNCNKNKNHIDNFNIDDLDGIEKKLEDSISALHKLVAGNSEVSKFRGYIHPTGSEDELDPNKGKNTSVDFKVLMNSDNEINNNTFMFINMKDNSNFVNNASNATFIIANNLETLNGSGPTISTSDKSNMDLLKKIFYFIFGNKYNQTPYLPTSSVEQPIDYTTDYTTDYANDYTIDYTNDYYYNLPKGQEDFDFDLPDPPQCGRNKNQIPVKGEYAWQVLLKEKHSSEMEYFCKGTLITRNHVLTTASCIRTRNIEAVLVYSRKLSTYVSQTIREIRVHEDFVLNSIQNDIAVIILDAPINDEEVTPICLSTPPISVTNCTGSRAYVPGINYYDIQMLKSQKIVNGYECLGKLYDLRIYLDTNERVICTKSKENEYDVCLENEGSPLIIKRKINGQFYYYQIGIVSGVNRCSEYNTEPGIFININFYLNWIVENM